jgi:hypothetical protein
VRWSTDNLPGGRLNQRLYVVVCYVVITIRFLAMRLNLPKWDILINYGTYKIKLWIIRNIKEPSCVEQGIWDFDIVMREREREREREAYLFSFDTNFQNLITQILFSPFFTIKIKYHRTPFPHQNYHTKFKYLTN